jgi:hypothetical protein
LENCILKASATWCNIGQANAIIHHCAQFAQSANQQASTHDEIVALQAPIHVRIACLPALYLNVNLPAALRFNVGFALSIALGRTFPGERKQLLQRSTRVKFTVLSLHA